MCSLLRDVLEPPFGAGETYNVGSEELNYSKIDIAEMLKQKTGAHVFSDEYHRILTSATMWFLTTRSVQQDFETRSK